MIEGRMMGSQIRSQNIFRHFASRDAVAEDGRILTTANSNCRFQT